MLLGARAGDVIWYYKTDKGVSIDPEEISILKYREMLMATVKDALEILGYEEALKESDLWDNKENCKEKGQVVEPMLRKITKGDTSSCIVA